VFIRLNNSVHLFLRAAAFLTAMFLCGFYVHYSTNMDAKWKIQSADTSENKGKSYILY